MSNSLLTRELYHTAECLICTTLLQLTLYIKTYILVYHTEEFFLKICILCSSLFFELHTK